MQLRLLAVGKIREPSIASACAEFRKRLAPYVPYDEIEVRAGDGSNADIAMRDESERLLKLVRPDDTVWLLERTGTQVSSEEFARKLETLAHSGISRLTLIIAGTFGAAPPLRERADFLWSLSKLTLLHEWARMFVIEQLYRAMKITRAEPYHH